jgi:hypothetical protein
MKDLHDYQGDIASIRSTMERSVKFLSLSGLSGVLAGIYALLGASLTYYLVYFPHAPVGDVFTNADDKSIILWLISIAIIILILSIATAYYMSVRKATKAGINFYNKTSKELLRSLFIPLITGGLLILILLSQGHFGLVIPACLIFYGLALIQTSVLTFSEIRYLGFSEILLGLLAALLPEYGLLFWAAGFGVLHIVYGLVMYYRYDS